MDPWYALGSADMLEVASMAAHVAQMTAREGLRACYRAVTETPAAILGLADTGLAVGKRADMVLLQAADPIEAIRLRPPRLAVIRAGRIIARTPPRITLLDLDGRPDSLDPAAYAPKAAP
jgi:cytosine deaminase